MTSEAAKKGHLLQPLKGENRVSVLNLTTSHMSQGEPVISFYDGQIVIISERRCNWCNHPISKGVEAFRCRSRYYHMTCVIHEYLIGMADLVPQVVSNVNW